MKKLISQNKEYQDPINVIQAKNISRTKKVSFDKNDRPPRLNNNNLKQEMPKESLLNLCVNGRGAVPTNSKAKTVSKGMTNNFNFN